MLTATPSLAILRQDMFGSPSADSRESPSDALQTLALAWCTGCSGFYLERLDANKQKPCVAAQMSLPINFQSAA